MYLLLISAAAVLYLFLIHPSGKRRREAKAFCKNSFAHRGLYGAVPENTLASFENARNAGYGIELDVQLTKDGEVVVFHDETLLRAAGRADKIADLSLAELKSIPLFGSEETIPLLAEALEAADGAPLLVEIKGTFAVDELCRKTADLLESYKGPVAVESFSPVAVRWFSKNRPQFLRGQLSSRFRDAEGRKVPFFQRVIVSSMVSNFLAKPDFIAYDVRNKNQLSFLLCRKLFRVPYLLWTVKGTGEGMIFEE